MQFLPCLLMRSCLSCIKWMLFYGNLTSLFSPRILNWTLHRCACVRVRMYACGGQRSICGVFLKFLPLYFSEAGFHTGFRAHRLSLAGWPASPRGHPVSTSRMVVLQAREAATGSLLLLFYILCINCTFYALSSHLYFYELLVETVLQ